MSSNQPAAPQSSGQTLANPASPVDLRDRLSQLPWWAFFLVGVGLLVIYLILNDADYRETFDYLKTGMIVTLRMTFIGFPIATLIGLVAGLARSSKNVIAYNLATLYVEVVRGIPLVVTILFFAFGIVPAAKEIFNQLGAWGLSWGQATFLNNFFTALANFDTRDLTYEVRAIIALAIGYGAFEAEVFRAGIQSISKGQMEAARSLGMTYMQAMRYVILPQAIRRVLPPLGNDLIALLKDSSLATIIAVPELTQLGRIRRAATFRVLETYYVIAFLYLSMTLLLSAGVRLLERVLRYDE